MFVKSLGRRLALSRMAALCSALVLLPSAALAEDRYPTKPVTIVVPYSPGGATDIVARVVGKKLGERWNSPVVIDNRAGASGLIGTDSVGKAVGDPYRLVLGTQAVFAVLPTLNQRPDINLETGFTPISTLIRMPSVLMVPASLPANTLPELIALLKAAAPDHYSFSSNGVGTSQQLIAEDFFQRIGVTPLHVPYKGSDQALSALAAGDQVVISVDNIPAALPYIASGKVKPLAVTTATRAPTLPDVPTIAESGVPGFDQSTWMGLMAPPDIPPQVRDFLSAEVREALKDPEVRQQLESRSFVVGGSTPEEFRAFVGNESANLQQMLQRLGIASGTGG